MMATEMLTLSCRSIQHVCECSPVIECQKLPLILSETHHVADNKGNGTSEHELVSGGEILPEAHWSASGVLGGCTIMIDLFCWPHFAALLNPLQLMPNCLSVLWASLFIF